MTAPPARIIGERYVVERRLAEGGMGTLFVARHCLTTQRVALKTLDRRLARDEASLERFLREVRVAARIGHPGVVRVLDAGIDTSPDGERVPFLAMELLTGETLAERLGRGNVPQAEALEHLAATLDPLAAAHAMGVVHRDLKPENLFLESLDGGGERVKLLDFGIARDIADDRHATAAGQCLGTVYYMAPEQCLDARAATPASDVWSFGAMLYQCLAGAFPFDGDTATAVMIAACRDPHRPLASHRPDLDPRVLDLVERCLRKSPDARPADADALRRELTPLLRDPALRASLAARPVAPWTYLPADVAAAPSASGVTALAPALIADAPPVPPAKPATAPELHLLSAPPSLTPPAPAAPPRAPRRALALAVALVAASVAGVAAFVLARPTPAPRAVAPSPIARPSVARAVVAPAPAAPVVPAVPVVTAAPARVAPAPVAPVTSPLRARRVRVATAAPVAAAPSAPPSAPPAAEPPSLLPEPSFARPTPPVRTAPTVAVAPTPAVAPPPPPPRPTHAPSTAAPDFVTF